MNSIKYLVISVLREINLTTSFPCQINQILLTEQITSICFRIYIAQCTLHSHKVNAEIENKIQSSFLSFIRMDFENSSFHIVVPFQIKKEKIPCEISRKFNFLNFHFSLLTLVNPFHISLATRFRYCDKGWQNILWPKLKVSFRLLFVLLWQFTWPFLWIKNKSSVGIEII